jgi:hypothetical protein
LESIVGLKLKTKDGDAIVNEIYISELGYLMIKLYFIEKKIFKGYNLMNLVKSLSDSGIEILNRSNEKKIGIFKK